MHIRAPTFACNTPYGHLYIALAVAAGAVARSEARESVCAWYFAFGVVDLFLITILAGSVFEARVCLCVCVRVCMRAYVFRQGIFATFTYTRAFKPWSYTRVHAHTYTYIRARSHHTCTITYIYAR